MLKDAIREAEAFFDHPNKQYVLFKDLEEQVSQMAVPDIPEALREKRHAAAYFGALLDSASDQAAMSEAQMIEEAEYIDTVVLDAIQTHSISPANIEAEIRKALLKRYFQVLGGIDAANELINQIIEIVRAGRVKSKP